MHHFALLIGYGAAAVNPYLALESIAEMVRDGLLGEMSEREAFRRYLKAASKGVLKVMSKMGISTVASYTGAQVFEAIGLERALVERYFGATPSRLGGVGLAELAEEVARRHRYAYDGPEPGAGELGDRGRRRVPVAPGRRVPPLQPPYRVQAPDTPRAPSASTSSRSTRASSTGSQSAWRLFAGSCGCARARPPCARRSPSTRSSRPRRS